MIARNYSSTSYKAPMSSYKASSNSYKPTSSSSKPAAASSYKPAASSYKATASAYKPPAPSNYSSYKQPTTQTNSTKTISNVSKGALSTQQNVLQSSRTNINYKTYTGKTGTTYSVMLDNRSVTKAKGIKKLDIFRFDEPHKINFGNDNINYHTNSNVKLGANNIQKTTLKALDHAEVPKPVYDAFKNFDDVAKFAKKGGKAVAVVGAVMDANDIYNAYRSDGNKIGNNTIKTSSGVAGSWAGGVAGAKAGAAGGAAIGTFICPGLGTAIGGFVGGLAGGIGGAIAGRVVGEKVSSTILK